MIESVTNKPVSAPAPVASSSGKTESAPAKATETAKVQQAATPINPRLRYDAVSGVVITEFLDQAGSIQAQTPSSAVVAYLRAGLSKDGMTREEKA
jgi:hypothetical protein